MDNIVKENIDMLIRNFEHDMRKAGKFDDTVDLFILDLTGLIEEINILFEKEYERGKDDGYKEAEDELGYDESLIDDLHKAKELIDDAISGLEGW